jgi:hypothetical protein
VDLTIEQARLLNLALNKILGDWNEGLLARLLAGQQPANAVAYDAETTAIDCERQHHSGAALRAVQKLRVAREMGACGFVRKPFSGSGLLQSIEQRLSGS